MSELAQYRKWPMPCRAAERALDLRVAAGTSVLAAIQASGTGSKHPRDLDLAVNTVPASTSRPGARGSAVCGTGSHRDLPPAHLRDPRRLRRSGREGQRSRAGGRSHPRRPGGVHRKAGRQRESGTTGCSDQGAAGAMYRSTALLPKASPACRTGARSTTVSSPLTPAVPWQRRDEPGLAGLYST